MTAVWESDGNRPFRAASVAICVAEEYRKKTKNKKNTKPLAACFDIDETLLRNSEYYGRESEDEYSVQKCGKMLYGYCAKNNIAIFLVTARRKSNQAKEYVKRQLSDLGYDLSKVKGLYMTSMEFDHLEDAGAAFKKEARAKICENYTIIINAGDRWTDVASDEAARELEKNHESNIYIGIVPNENGIVQGVKFPEFD